jgi:hypothetical protein
LANVNVHHVSLKHNESARQASSDKPMVWAVRKADGSIVHVAQLTKAERGLNCECECPACRSDLQAVNAGVGADHFLKPKTLGQFFRHVQGQQRDGCLLLIARVAALQLLFERGEIDLPGPRQRATLTGASGNIYVADTQGPPQRFKVRHRAWIDSQSASLTLEDGRVVLLQLDSEHRLTDQGEFDGVISIQVADPEVASWPAEKILQHAQLDAGFMCWNKHWDDADLQAQAQGLAEDQARDACDLAPEDEDLANMTAAQRNESALHLAVKMILAEAGEIHAPTFQDKVRHVMPSGRSLVGPVSMNLGVLKLRSVFLEKRIDQVVPDVVCIAQTKSGHTFNLMIEVAVTHRVDEAKRQKIVAMDMACLEIDITKFQKQGRISLRELSQEVLKNRGNKAWIHHPFIEGARAVALRELSDKAQKIQENEDIQERMQSWLAGLEWPKLRQIYFNAVVHLWNNDHIPFVDNHFLHWEGLAQALKLRGCHNWDAPILVRSGGILHCLETIRNGETRMNFGHIAKPIDTTEAMFIDPEARRYVSYALIALKVYAPALSANENQRLLALRKKNHDSLSTGHLAYARTREFDDLISELFPEMGELIQHPYGTTAYAQAQRKERLAKEHHEMAERERRRLELAREEARREEAAALASEIEWASQVGWAEATGFTNSLDQVYTLEEVKRLVATNGRLKEVLRSAWDARANSVPLKAWYQSMKPENISQLSSWKHALRQAWLTM